MKKGFRSLKNEEPKRKYEVKTLARCWSDFESAVIPETAHPKERERAKMVFYAGAAYVFDQNLALGETHMNEAACIRHLESIGAELRAFRVELEAIVAKEEAN